MASENAASCVGIDGSSPTSSEPLRMVLVGRTGSGRSSSGNTILARTAFWEDCSPSSVTTRCKRQTGTIGRWSLSVIDTPGFFHTHLSPQEVMAEVGQCVTLYAAGPHAFLLTLQIGRFTQEERETLKWLKARFGPEITRFTMVLFTWGDQLQGKSIEDFLEESPELSAFVSSCDGGYHAFNNTEQDEAMRCLQAVQLLEKVDKMVEKNDGSYYTSEVFKEAESAMTEAQQKLQEEKRYVVKTEDKEHKAKTERTRREEDEARKREERLFWYELVTALGRGAAEGAGIMEKDEGKPVKKVKVVEKAAALAASPLSIKSAVKVVGGAVKEGSKVLYKHNKMFSPLKK